MKRIVAFALCLVTIMVLTIAPLATASAADRSYQYVNSYKNGLPVRLRPAPSTNNTEIAKLNHRDVVLVYEYNKQRTWAYVETDNPMDGATGTIKGWISTEFLSKKDPGPWKGPKPVPTPTDDTLNNLSAVAAKIKPVEVPYTAEIITKNPTALVHLRWFPNTSAKYLDAFPRGTVVTVLAKSAKWVQVAYTPADTEQMHVGFVLADNVAEYAYGQD